MKRFFLFSAVALFFAFPTVVFAQMPDELDLEPSQGNQQNKGIELTKTEIEGILSTACSDSSTLNQRAIADSIAQEVDTSLSKERLEELTETAIEIKELSSQEKTALCQS